MAVCGRFYITLYREEYRGKYKAATSCPGAKARLASAWRSVEDLFYFLFENGVRCIPHTVLNENVEDPEEIIKTLKYIAPTFGGINLEDISSPRCFEIEDKLIRELIF